MHVFTDNKADTAQGRIKDTQIITARQGPGLFARAQVRLPLAACDVPIGRKQVRLRHKRIALCANNRTGHQPHAKAQSQPGAGFLKGSNEGLSLLAQHRQRVGARARRAEQRQSHVLRENDQLRARIYRRLDGRDQTPFKVCYALRAKVF